MNREAEKERLIKQLEQVEDYELIKAIQSILDYALQKQPSSYRDIMINKNIKGGKKEFFDYAGMWSGRDIDGKTLRRKAWNREK